MSQVIGESWRFEVACPHADSVLLVKQRNDIGKTCLPMKPQGRDVWRIDVALTPGRYRMSYYLVDGQTTISGGAFGLTASRLTEHDPAVIIEA